MTKFPEIERISRLTVQKTKQTRGSKMSEKRISEISCPKCGKKFHAIKPRTKKQWKMSLVVHLISAIKYHHNLKSEEASSIADRYLESL
jgi:hypothetical protein